jgi:DNA ligase-1
MPDGREFNAKMAGNTAELKKAWENPKLWVGKMLTVQFQNYTPAGIPRFPVGLRLREEA